MSRLIIKNLVKKYDDEKTDYLAVNDVSFECNDGEFIGILGPSGCGKSTTLRTIAGLERVSSGEIYVDTNRIDQLHPKKRNIGLAFEDYALYPPLTVYDNVAFNLKAKNIDKDIIKKEMDIIAPLLKIDEILHLKPAVLSGGQKQRVNIARALIRKPDILLLDEPMSHLDGKMRQQLRIEIKRLHKEINCTTILVTHDQLEAMTLADRIAVMNLGVLLQFDTPNEIYNNPVNEFVASFIGDPPMNILETDIINESGQYYFHFKESNVKIKAPKKYNEALQGKEKVKLGIRPTDIFLTNDKSGSPLKVTVFEDLGDEKRFSVAVGEDKYLSFIINDDVYCEEGDTVHIAFNDNLVHIFDLETGNKLN